MRQKFAYLRLYIDRARGYIGYFNFFMIFVVFAKNTDIIPNITPITVVFIVLFFVSVLLGIGFLDVYLGMFKNDLQVRNSQNPMFIEMLARIRNIEDTLKPKD